MFPSSPASSFTHRLSAISKSLSTSPTKKSRHERFDDKVLHKLRRFEERGYEGSGIRPRSGNGDDPRRPQPHILSQGSRARQNGDEFNQRNPGPIARRQRRRQGPAQARSPQISASPCDADILSVLKRARAIRAQLEDMDGSNAANRRLSGCKAGTPVDRTRSAVTNGLRKKLKELMMDFQGLRQRMMTEYKETVGRRYFTVTGEYPDEEVIEKIISSGDGNGGEELLSRAIQEHGRGKVVETVIEIQDRHGAAKEIEQSLLELHQIFLDMAVMVEAQGEQMDDIEHHVMNAAHYVNDGAKNLKIAKDHQKSSRRCLCIGVILLLVLVLVVIVPIIASFSKS